MTGQIYNLGATAASSISMNPLQLIALIAVVLAIATGLAGRLAVLCEDLRYPWLFGRNQ